jgi:hypothetical protein
MTGERPAAAWPIGWLRLLAFGLLAASAIFHLAFAATGRSFYRDIHLGTAIEYAHMRIDLLRPVIVGFNATGTPTPQEFPVWQALAAVAFKILGPWFGWANLVSLLLFATCVYPLYQIIARYCGGRCAWWTLIFFLAEPLVFLYAGLASTDGFSLAAAIWFLYFAINLLESPRLVWWIPTALAAAFAAVFKLPFFMAAGLVVFFLAALFHRSTIRPWILLGGAAVFAGAVFSLWTHYTDGCIARAEFRYVDLRLSNPQMVFWYFGSMKYRLSPGPWIKGVWRILNGCLGSLVFAAIVLASLMFVRQHVLGRLLLAAAVLTNLVFTHLFFQHWHYFLLYSPALALLCAQAAVAGEQFVARLRGWQVCAAFGLVVLTLVLSLMQGLVSLKLSIFYDPFRKDIVNILKDKTSTTDKLIIAGGGWGGEELFRSGRQGLSIWGTDIFNDPKNLQRLKELGYDRLVLISESPLQYAIQAVNFGETGEPRESYQKYLSPLVQSWPTLFQTDDILIKELP